MSESFSVECPHCHARGDLSDPALLGQPILCPACQVVFTAPLPVSTSPLRSSDTVDAVISPNSIPSSPPFVATAVSSAIPNFAPELPTSGFPTTTPPTFAGSAASSGSPLTEPAVNQPYLDFLTPPEPTGVAEELFASSLPQPVARGSIQPPKPKSVILMTVVWSSISSIVLFAAVMFIAGDPWRGYDAKYKARDAEVAKKKKRVVLPVPVPEDRSLADAVERIRGITPAAEPSVSKEMPEEMLAEAAVIRPETFAVPSLADTPIDVIPFPDVDPDIIASALIPENMLSDESLLQALTNGPTHFKNLNDVRDDPATYLPRLVRLVESDDDAIHERAWELLNVLGDEKSWRNELRKTLAGDDVAGQITAALILHRRLSRRESSPELIQHLVGWATRGQGHLEAATLLVEIGRGAAANVAELLTDGSLAPDLRQRLELLVANQSSDYRRAILPYLREGLKSDVPLKRDAAAWTIARLNPREPDLLSLIIPSLNVDDAQGLQQAARALGKMADAEIDVSSAFPVPMRVLTAGPAESGNNETTAIDESLRDAVVAVLKVTGISSEHLPELRQMLRNAVGLNLKSDDSIRHPTEAVNYGSSALNVLALLGSEAQEAIPEIRAFLEITPGKDWANQLFAIGEPAIEMLIDAARQSESKLDVRVSAIRMLGRLASESDLASNALIDLSKDENLDVRTEAALAVIRNGRPESMEVVGPVLQETLRSDGEARRLTVISQLNSFGHRGATFVPDLAQITRQDDAKPWERQVAARTLLKLAPEDAAAQAAYIDCLKATGDRFFDSDIAAYGESLIPQLTECLKVESDPLRIAAAGLLGNFGERAFLAAPVLRELLQAENPRLRTVAAISLARIDSTAQETLPSVMDSLESRVPGAVEALQHLGPNAAAALPKLMELIEDRTVTTNAIRVIAAMGSEAKPAIPLLLESLMGRPLELAAMNALSELGEHATEASPVLIEMIRRDKGPQNLARILPRLGQSAADAAKLLCDDLQNDETRLNAVEKLSLLGAAAGPAASQLLEYARSDDDELRIAAMKALGAIDASAAESVPVIAGTLSDPNPQVAVTAAESLTALAGHASAAIPQITAALNQNRRMTQPTLIRLLAELGPAASDAIPSLEKLTQSPNLSLRHAARAALKKIRVPEDSDQK